MSKKIRNFAYRINMAKCAHNIWYGVLVCVFATVVSSCSTTKFVPQDKYLLNKMHVRIEDRKDVQSVHKEHSDALDPDELADKMKSYVRQKNNSEIFGFWKLQLQVYSLAKPDSSKWINRTLWKMGEAPEVFDPMLADASLLNIRQGMYNYGYFNAVVDTTMIVKDRKLSLTYHITAGQPYVVRSYTVRLPQEDLKDIATDERRCLIKAGMVFNANTMNEERERISRAMRRNGYYYFDNDMLRYRADSAYMRREVSLELTMPDYVTEAPDSVRKRIFTRYRIRRVNFYADADPDKLLDTEDITIRTDSDGYTYVYSGKKLLREKVLRKNCPIRPGDYYNIARVDRAYSSLNTLGPVKYVDISFDDVGNDELDCNVVLSRGKLNAVSAELEGTYSAGDWGIATGVGYSNLNIFRGAEELSVNGYGSYEWRQNGGRAIEGKAEASLKFPNAPQVLVGYRYQNRPEEFTRTVANASLSYTYRQFGSRLSHHFDFVDISYVYLPWISDEFRAAFLKPSNLLRYSYEDHFIVDWSYTGTWSSYRQRNPYQNYGTLTYHVETAGNLLYGISAMASLPKDAESNAYQIFNIPFSQYAKADFSFSYHQIFSKEHRLVYHAALGVAVPYLNAKSIPFEKRYFAGGANSVRGWLARNLGPGGYRGTGALIDYNNQSGDIKLDLNIEYRWKVWSILELAAFTDAGNIWTIDDYESQPYGKFSFGEFYKQIAWSYGVGVRLDLSFFIFRVDFGVKLYDPSRINYDNRYGSDYGGPWRTASQGLCWKDDMSFHFAIGYPF